MAKVGRTEWSEFRREALRNAVFAGTRSLGPAYAIFSQPLRVRYAYNQALRAKMSIMTIGRSLLRIPSPEQAFRTVPGPSKSMTLEIEPGKAEFTIDCYP